MSRALAFDHLVLVVRDVETTLAWYQLHLGLEGVRVEEWRRGEVPFPSLRVTPETIIDLVPGFDGPSDQSRPDQSWRGHLDHICFVVSADEQRTLRAGLEVIEEGRRFGAQGNADSIYVRDPDGLVVEFRTYPD